MRRRFCVASYATFRSPRSRSRRQKRYSSRWLAGCRVSGVCGPDALLQNALQASSGMAWIQPGVTFVETNRLVVGKNFGVNTGTYINAIGGITMGDYVLIGSNVTISSGRHTIEGRMPPVFARPAVPLPSSSRMTFGSELEPLSCPAYGCAGERSWAPMPWSRETRRSTP